MEASVTDVYCVDVTGGGVGDEETVLSNINRPAVSSHALFCSSLYFYLHARPQINLLTVHSCVKTFSSGHLSGAKCRADFLISRDCLCPSVSVFEIFSYL